MQIRALFSHALRLALLGVLLSACSPVPTRPQQPVDPDIARAAQLWREAQFSQASALYETLARRHPGPRARDYLLKAIDAALQAGDPDRAEALLGRLSGAPLSPEQGLRRELLSAELALARHQGDQALETLLGMIRPKMPHELALRHLRDLATAYRQVGNLLESANTLQQLDALLGEDREQRLEVQSEILRALTALNERTLRELQPSPPGVAGGWMELALLFKQYGATPEALAPRLQAWRERFPGHPALPELLTRSSARLQAQLRTVRHIAVLLPESGRYAAAARALRDGIMASWFALPEAQRPMLRFYDSSDPYNAWPLYSQAVAAGAEAIIGPLQKASVAQLLKAGELAVPVLALNQVPADSAPPARLYMFSLDPEHEARLAAERIWQQDQRHPVALYPDNAWGERLVNAFRDRWQALTGDVIEARAYRPDSPDHSQVIRELMHLDRSKARHRRLERWLGQSIEFEPRRRHDVDAVFTVARPQQAQGLRPQLAFFRAGDLPMYATSAAWTGSLNPQQLADMKGILLPDIPLIADPRARARLGEALPGVLGPGVRLYAMGMDALHLLPHLQRLQDSPYESLDGRTGNLFMSADHRIRRQLVWLSLDDPPRVLGYSRRMDLEQAPAALPPAAAPAVPAAGRSPQEKATETP